MSISLRESRKAIFWKVASGQGWCHTKYVKFLEMGHSEGHFCSLGRGEHFTTSATLSGHTKPLVNKPRLIKATPSCTSQTKLPRNAIQNANFSRLPEHKKLLVSNTVVSSASKWNSKQGVSLILTESGIT